MSNLQIANEILAANPGLIRDLEPASWGEGVNTAPVTLAAADGRQILISHTKESRQAWALRRDLADTVRRARARHPPAHGGAWWTLWKLALVRFGVRPEDAHRLYLRELQRELQKAERQEESLIPLPFEGRVARDRAELEALRAAGPVPLRLAEQWPEERVVWEGLAEVGPTGHLTPIGAPKHLRAQNSLAGWEVGHKCQCSSERCRARGFHWERSHSSDAQGRPAVPWLTAAAVAALADGATA